jgi:transposase
VTNAIGSTLFKLADLLRLNRFKEVRYPQEQLRRDFKAVVQHYDEMTQQQARLKTKIKARLRMQGVIVRGSEVFSARGCQAVLSEVKSPLVRTAITQLFAVFDQSLESQAAAEQLMRRAGQALPEIKTMRTAPGVGPIGACRFSAYIHTPQRFSSTRQLWEVLPAQCQSSQQQWEATAPAASGPLWLCRLKDVSRKAFEAALRTSADNGFKRAYYEALAQTHDATHARLTVQRKIVSTLRAM